MGSLLAQLPGRARFAWLGISLAQLFCFGDVAAADLLADGRSLYENKCGGCHSVETDRIGPRHRGVVGRRVASVPGYDYSPALKQLGGVWTPTRLDLWLSDTQKMAPRSRMYLALDDADQRRRIIAYLQSVSHPVSSP